MLLFSFLCLELLLRLHRFNVAESYPMPLLNSTQAMTGGYNRPREDVFPDNATLESRSDIGKL